MAKFHSLQIKDVRKETADSVSIAFAIPEDSKSDFGFINGQYITLKADLNGEEVRRSYSLSSCLTTDQEHRIAVKKVDGGKMSTWLTQEVSAGDSIDVAAPEGGFHPDFDSNQTKSYVLFAAGSGITPIISILKGVLANEPDSKVVLFYGNSTEEDIIFKTELDALASQNEQFTYYNIISQAGKKGGMGLFKKKDIFAGRMDNKKVVALLNQYADLSIENEFYICGPTGMMQTVQNALNNLRVPAENINVEYFTAPESDDASTTNVGSQDAKAVIILDDEEEEINIPAGTTVLDAALDEGIDAPYSCRGAVCSSCMAKLEEGEVEMKMNYVLTDDEVKDGYIVTCQAVAKSAKLKVNYDV